jgi:hypothetical protein
VVITERFDIDAEATRRQREARRSN